MASSHRELRAWKRADVIRRRIVALCAEPTVRRDFKFCEQADSAAASACRNIAEGFARYSHGEFAWFVGIARGSLGELRDSADEARLKRYISDEEWNSLDRDLRGAMSSASELRRYLLKTPTPDWKKRPRSPKQPRRGR